MLVAKPHRIFCDGADGRLHALAHRALNTGRLDEGRRALAGWTLDEPGRGERAVHLHWHQLVFDLAAGDAALALRRFHRHVRPAIARNLANTDGPQALWRLSLAGYDPGRLCWIEARQAAKRALLGPLSDYARLHAALAFAGAADFDALRGMLGGPLESPVHAAIHDVVCALLDLQVDPFRAADRLEASIPDIPAIGGSKAQNELFCRIVDHLRTRPVEVAAA